MNIHFSKNNQTRFVKHGFSWQVFFFGPVAFLFRAQYKLAAICLAAGAALYMAIGIVLVMALDIDTDGGPNAIIPISLLITAAVVGYFANRFSARDYVKNGWQPVADFPSDWNAPQLIAPKTPNATSV